MRKSCLVLLLLFEAVTGRVEGAIEVGCGEVENSGASKKLLWESLVDLIDGSKLGFRL